MSDDKKSNKFVMIILMALPVLLGGMWILSKNMDKKEKPLVSDQSLIIPEVEETEGMNDEKAKIYRDEQTEKLYKQHSDAKNVASDKDFYAIDPEYVKEEKKQQQPLDAETEKVLAQYREPDKEQQPQSASNPQVGAMQTKNQTQSVKAARPKAQPSSENNREVVSNDEKEKPKTEPQEDKPKRRSSMGIYTAESYAPNAKSEKTAAPSKNYLKAVLEEDKTIQNGSNVIFVLSQSGVIDGTQHKKGSILYGRATQGKEFFEVNIYQVKSANDGNTYPADLIVYDENYNRGIRSEGYLNEVSKEEGTDALTETVDESTRGASSVRALDIATRAISRTVSKTQRSKPVSIPLKKGYKVYLQPKEKEK